MADVLPFLAIETTQNSGLPMCLLCSKCIQTFVCFFYFYSIRQTISGWHTMLFFLSFPFFTVPFCRVFFFLSFEAGVGSQCRLSRLSLSFLLFIF